jgi:hypothetical protein
MGFLSGTACRRAVKALESNNRALEFKSNCTDLGAAAAARINQFFKDWAAI